VPPVPRTGVVAPVVDETAASTRAAATLRSRSRRCSLRTTGASRTCGAARARDCRRPGRCRFRCRARRDRRGPFGRARLTRFNLRLDDVRIRSGDVECDASVRPWRKSRAVYLVPRLARVGALPDRAARSAAVEAAAAAPALITGRIDDIRVGWIENDVGESR